MRILSPPGLALLSILTGCAAPGARPSVVPEQAKGPIECGVALGHTLSLNGRVWVTESDEQMREWLGRIDSADVRSMEVLKGAAAALYGADGARSTVVVTLRPGSRSERRFRSPPPPRSGYAYCCGMVRRFVESARDTAGRAAAPAEEPRPTSGQPPS